ncbi:MAG: 3-dehydroquinate synthase [Rubrobacter sp.]
MSQQTVEVPVAHPYPVVVGAGIDLAETLSRTLDPGPCAVVTDSTVGQLHASSVRDALQSAGWNVAGMIEVEPGEPSKSLWTYAQTIRDLARLGLTRDATLFALGGGVVGDLGGFLAATYLRGIDLVMLPTSLLAAVDSSVGGKVGVDLPEGKNLVGAFVRPRLVAADLDWLRTLPEREISNGLAETVKMGLLAGGAYFDDLRLIEGARAGDQEALLTLVLHSVRFKAEVVAEDELEGGPRAILNYGHTIGHALEAAAGYTVPHGEAVAAGMVAAARLSNERFGTDLTGLHEALIEAAGLPLSVPKVSSTEALLAMGRDKKRSGADAPGYHRFVLLEDVGRPVRGVPVHEDEALRAMESVIE